MSSDRQSVTCPLEEESGLDRFLWPQGHSIEPDPRDRETKRPGSSEIGTVTAFGGYRGELHERD